MLANAGIQECLNCLGSHLRGNDEIMVNQRFLKRSAQ